MITSHCRKGTNRGQEHVQVIAVGVKVVAMDGKRRLHESVVKAEPRRSRKK
jgi:hypothetical protein